MPVYTSSLLLPLLLPVAGAFEFALRPTSASRRSTRASHPPTAVFYTGSEQRRPLIAGNWKLNPATLSEAKSLLKLVAANQRAIDRCRTADSADVAVFPPFPFLPTAIEMLAGTSIKVGAQNIGVQAKPGAFTGEVCASMVASLGCSLVLLGHSERRSLFGEGDDEINAKVLLTLAAGLEVVLCVGETEEEYEMELLEAVVAMQLRKGLAGVTAAQMGAGRVVVAYEPVWAIGTGKVATPEQAQNAHAIIRRILSDMFTADAARSVLIQYGGSVSPESVDELMAQPDIDGALVGGASLVADKFSRIVDFTPPLRPRDNPRIVTTREVVACGNTLGESPVWSAREQRLYWCSAVDKEVWSWNLRDAPFKRVFDCTVGCVALRAGGGLLIALEDRIISYDVERRSAETVVAAPEPASLTRCNDGRVDRGGSFVFGMYNNYHRAGPSAGDDNAGLYRLREGGALEELLDYKFRVSNSLCFSPDGRTMYFCDTPTRKIFAWDYSSSGTPTNQRLVYSVPPALAGGPDGAQTDDQGFLWAAISGAGRVVRIDPQTGATDLVVVLPVASPTSVTFGGEDLDTLYITTRGPDGGGLYAVRMPFGIRGVAEPEARV